MLILNKDIVYIKARIVADWDSHPKMWKLNIPFDNNPFVDKVGEILDIYFTNIGLVSLIIGQSGQSTTQF